MIRAILAVNLAVAIITGGTLVSLSRAKDIKNYQEPVKTTQQNEAADTSLLNETERKVTVISEFLDNYDSPLKPYSKVFVDVADKYGLDYRLLPAISCMESTCGKRLIPNSYNPFGWGIYGNVVTRFGSYEEAIDVVGKGLKDNYLSKGLDTPAKIAPVYTPPMYQHWLSGVMFFYDKIDSVEKTIFQQAMVNYVSPQNLASPLE